MSANPIPAPSDDPALQPVALPVAEIEAVCSKHSILCGEPDSLDRFLRALHTDKHLAMDFWSLVARLTDRNPAADSGLLLAAIVQGVVGRSLDEVSASNPLAQLQLRELSGLLAGEDVETPLPPRPVQSARPPEIRSHFRDAVPRRGGVPPPRSSSDSTAPTRLVLRTDTPFAAALDLNPREREREPDPDPQPPEPPIAVPPAAYAETSEHNASVSPKLLGGILLALAATGILLYHSNRKRFSTSIRTQYTAALAGRNHTVAPSATSINGDQSFAVNLKPAAVPANPNAPLAPRNAPSAAPIAAALPPHDTATRQPRADAQIVVPEALMRQNLISSRVPIFPQGATGSVVIQAIVTARGTVEPLDVVSGDPALAHAAMAAAATWRYRPYRQNGVPINVSTTISISVDGND
jgi:TonB family protein